jgi:hypothetical protein
MFPRRSDRLTLHDRLIRILTTWTLTLTREKKSKNLLEPNEDLVQIHQ